MFNDLSCYAEQLFKWRMKRKVIFDYIDHRLVFNASVSSRSATLINFRSFNIISLVSFLRIDHQLLNIVVVTALRGADQRNAVVNRWIYQGLLEDSSTCSHLLFREACKADKRSRTRLGNTGTGAPRFRLAFKLPSQHASDAGDLKPSELKELFID